MLELRLFRLELGLHLGEFLDRGLCIVLARIYLSHFLSESLPQLDDLRFPREEFARANRLLRGLLSPSLLQPDVDVRFLAGKPLGKRIGRRGLGLGDGLRGGMRILASGKPLGEPLVFALEPVLEPFALGSGQGAGALYDLHRQLLPDSLHRRKLLHAGFLNVLEGVVASLVENLSLGLADPRDPKEFLETLRVLLGGGRLLLLRDLFSHKSRVAVLAFLRSLG